MELVDTHCHIQFSDYKLDPAKVIADARVAGVTRLVCVGCRLEDSRLGVTFAQQSEGIWASIGLHPHEAKTYVGDSKALADFAALANEPKVVAIGECGLDYYYNHSPKKQQIKLLNFQIELALSHDLPVIFHVRDAFDDFWPIFDNYPGLRGVIHSFSAGTAEMDQILAHPTLYVGINGIMTFTKQADQLAATKAIPLERLLLETDAPYLTPVPYRGTINEPKYVRNITQFLVTLRGEDIQTFAHQTTKNAQTLFNLI
jgi:TatD DNase family protein